MQAWEYTSIQAQRRNIELNKWFKSNRGHSLHHDFAWEIIIILEFSLRFHKNHLKDGEIFSLYKNYLREVGGS